MSDERNPSSRDPLDDWLAEARWPEPTAMATERLRMQWRDLRRPRSRRSIGFALAAAVVIATTVWVVMTMRSPHATPIAFDPFVRPAAASPAPRLAGRELTGLEKTLLDAQSRKKASKAKAPAVAVAVRPVSRPAAPAPEPQHVFPVEPQRPAPAVAVAPPIAIRPYLERVADESTRAAALAELDRMKSPPTEQLLGFFTDSRMDLRVAAALALGRIDGPVLTNRLINMVAAGQNRREAFIALAASRGPEAHSFVRQAVASQNLSGLARSTLSMNELQ